MKWHLYHPIFEFQEILNLSSYPWLGHIHFAYDLIANIRPKTVVELGVARGISFFSFCQGIKDFKLKTNIYAIDSWQGDEHTGKYDQDIFNTVKKIRVKYYPDTKITILKQTFDSAITKFKDNSIDLLHIDGYHTYKAVAHDFKTWLPKMKVDGIILFHDIAERRSDFGVYKLWEKLKKKYNTYQFIHSHGLGVLFLGKNNILADCNNFKLAEYYNSLYISEKKQIDKINSLINKNNYLLDKMLQREKIYKSEVESLSKQNKKLITEIKVIKSSKFWKLRNQYYRLLGRDID